MDALTYAGNLDSVARRGRERALHVRARRHLRRRRGRAPVRDAPARRRDPPRGREPRRPLHRRAGGVRPDQRRRHVHAARGGAAPRGASATRAFRFLHVSTDEVYGTLGDTGLFTEETPYAPNSPYSASKAASDHLARAYHHTYGLRRRDDELLEQLRAVPVSREADPVVILKAVAGKPLPVYGTGANVRDWLYVDDHVRALVAAFERGKSGRDLQRRRAQRADQPRRRRAPSARCSTRCGPTGAPHERLITFVTDRPGHDARYAIDASQDRPRARLDAARDVRDGPAQDRPLVPRQRRVDRARPLGRVPHGAPRTGLSAPCEPSAARGRHRNDPAILGRPTRPLPMKGILLAGGSGTRLYPRHAGREQAAAAGLRQADGLLPAHAR